MSVADSPRGGKSTGNIYLYLLHIDYITHDLRAENKLTVLFSNNQDLACEKRGLDPMEPTCSRVMITGFIAQVCIVQYSWTWFCRGLSSKLIPHWRLQIPSNTTEYNFAAAAFLSRHPASTRWIKRHNSILVKVEIKQIAVLDYYGGQHYVTVADYYDANIDDLEVEWNNNDESQS